MCLLSSELFDLDREHFDVGHLLVQELHNALKRVRYLISNEQKTHALGGEVRGHFHPETIGIWFSIRPQQSPEYFTRVLALCTG